MTDADLQQQIRGFLQSQYWQLLRTWLCNRRQQLFDVDAQTTEQLWQNMGALREINRLLKSPELALLEFARANDSGVAEDRQVPFWVKQILQDEEIS